MITVGTWRIYRLSRSICGTCMDCHGRCVTYVYIYIYIYIYIDIHGRNFVICRLVHCFSLSGRMSHLPLTSNTLTNHNNTAAVRPNVVAHRLYRGVFTVKLLHGFTAYVILFVHIKVLLFRRLFSVDSQMLNCIMCKPLRPKPNSRFGQFGQTFTDAPL